MHRHRTYDQDQGSVSVWRCFFGREILHNKKIFSWKDLKIIPVNVDKGERARNVAKTWSTSNPNIWTFVYYSGTCNPIFNEQNFIFDLGIDGRIFIELNWFLIYKNCATTHEWYCLLLDILICRSRQTNGSIISYFSIPNNGELHSSQLFLCSFVSPVYFRTLSMRIMPFMMHFFSKQNAIWWRYRMQTIKTLYTIFCELSAIQINKIGGSQCNHLFISSNDGAQLIASCFK